MIHDRNRPRNLPAEAFAGFGNGSGVWAATP